MIRKSMKSKKTHTVDHSLICSKDNEKIIEDKENLISNNNVLNINNVKKIKTEVTNEINVEEETNDCTSFLQALKKLKKEENPTTNKMINAQKKPRIQEMITQDNPITEKNINSKEEVKTKKQNKVNNKHQNQIIEYNFMKSLINNGIKNYFHQNKQDMHKLINSAIHQDVYKDILLEKVLYNEDFRLRLENSYEKVFIRYAKAFLKERFFSPFSEADKSK